MINIVTCLPDDAETLIDVIGIKIFIGSNTVKSDPDHSV